MYWLITYSKLSYGVPSIKNTTTSLQPGEWLIDKHKIHKETFTILINAIEITEHMYEELNILL